MKILDWFKEKPVELPEREKAFFAKKHEKFCPNCGSKLRVTFCHRYDTQTGEKQETDLVKLECPNNFSGCIFLKYRWESPEEKWYCE